MRKKNSGLQTEETLSENHFKRSKTTYSKFEYRIQYSYFIKEWFFHRVQPGYCFHLFTRHRAEALEDYQLPEMMRTPLEELCLQIKVTSLDLFESSFPHWKRRIFSPFSQKYACTRSVFESFSPVHTKTLKRWKYDTISYGTCVMLVVYDVWHRRIRKPPFSSVHT